MANKDEKILVIVESPAKCANVTKYLHNAGYTNVTTMASVGHISSLVDDKNSFKNSGVYPENNFSLNIKPSIDKKDVVNKLTAQAKLADTIYLMTDGDREGESIAWSILEFAKIKKEKCFRAITREITQKAVVNAIENPVPLDYKLIEAAHARLAIDKLIGYGLSPVAKSYIGAKSVGRCQSIGLKLVVDREDEINNFIPTEYFDLYVNFIKNNHKYSAKYLGTTDNALEHINSEQEALAIKHLCSSDYVIIDKQTRTVKEYPKPPYCTATYQQDAANILGLSVKSAMAVAQKLYEAGYITYMRSDSTAISKDFTPMLMAYTKKVYGMANYPKIGKTQDNAQNGHEGIRITDTKLTPEQFVGDQENNISKKVYALIYNRTLASVMDAAEFSENTYTISNNGQMFSFSTKKLEKQGFKCLYTKENQPDVDDFNINEILVIDEVANGN